MDSFFAAAENLDHLLDELEENEESDHRSPASTLHGAKKDLSVERSHVLKDAGTTSNNLLKIAPAAVQKDTIADEYAEPNSHPPNGSLEILTETIQTPKKEPMDLLPEHNGTDFADPPKENVGDEVPKTNSDLLIDIFGAPAAPFENSDKQFVYSGPISPLNPFLMDIMPQQNVHKAGTSEQSNTTYNFAEDSSFRPTNGTKSTSHILEEKSQTADLLDDESVMEGAMCIELLSEQNKDSSQTPNTPMSIVDTHVNNAPQAINNSSNQEENNLNDLVPSEVQSENQSKQNRVDSPSTVSNDISKTERDFDRFWNDFPKPNEFRSDQTPMNLPEGSGAIPKRSGSRASKPQESPSTPQHPENDAGMDAGIQQPIANAGIDSKFKRIRMADHETVHPPPPPGDEENKLDVVEKAQNLDEDLGFMEELPDDLKISDQEFEAFLSQTQITKPVGVAKNKTVGSTSNNVPVPAISMSQTNGPDNESSMEEDTPPEEGANQDRADTNQSLHLHIEGNKNEQSQNGSNYPVTPPPPYTDEMQNMYQQHLSSEWRSNADGQADTNGPAATDGLSTDQSVQQGVPIDEDGFSFLPSAVLQSITRPGETKPEWVPDADAPQCSNCAVKFTFTKRRHHCRACGRVFCSACCSSKSPLRYLEFKEARVCSMCSLAIMQADALEEMSRRGGLNTQNVAPRGVVHAEGAAEPQSSEAPQEDHIEQASEPVIPHSESIPVPLPQREGPEGAASRVPATKSVRFSDGTRPKHPDEMPSTPPPPTRVKRGRRRYGYYPPHSNNPDGSELPPIIIAHGENGTYAVEENPDMNVVIGLLESGGVDPQSFVLNPNLLAHVRFITYSQRQCWCFWSEGLDCVGQKEVAFLLEREGLGDRQLPIEVFTFFNCIFDRARKGRMFSNTDFMQIAALGMDDDQVMFGLKENAGFLFVRPTSQSMEGLSLTRRKDSLTNGPSCESPKLLTCSMLFAILVQKMEAPWATLFPMRLMLRLGKETNQYPCPLFSVRKRDPVFQQLGHTILAILCDFRNFKYRVVSVPGLRVVVASSGSISIQIPCNRFTDTVKIMNCSNDSVLAMGTGTFGPQFPSGDVSGPPVDSPCDSHLVCVQDPTSSNYHTEIISVKEAGRKFTGAAFVIFNGSLKSDGNHQAKCAIVEDGIMVQLLPEKMEQLRASLRSMDDFCLEMGPVPSTPQPEMSNKEVTLIPSQDGPPTVEVKWIEDDTAFNIGMYSPIDGTPFEGVVGFNVQGRSEQKGRRHTLRWNQVFFLNSTSDPLDMSRLAEQVANGCFLALTPVLQELAKHRQHKIAVRVTIHPDNVGYVAGSSCRTLPPICMNALDDNLIPTIHNAASNVPTDQDAVIIELLFSILLLRPGYRTA